MLSLKIMCNGPVWITLSQFRNKVCAKLQNHKFPSAGKVSIAFLVVDCENDMAAFFLTFLCVV